MTCSLFSLVCDIKPTAAACLVRDLLVLSSAFTDDFSTYSPSLSERLASAGKRISSLLLLKLPGEQKKSFSSLLEYCRSFLVISREKMCMPFAHFATSMCQLVNSTTQEKVFKQKALLLLLVQKKTFGFFANKTFLEIFH